MYFKHEVTPVVHVHSGVLRVHVLRCSTVYDSPPLLLPLWTTGYRSRRYTTWRNFSIFRKFEREREREKRTPRKLSFFSSMQISRWNLRSNGSIHPPRFNYELCNSVYVRQRRHENCDSASIHVRMRDTRGGFDEVEENSLFG